jgi:dTDP-4-dehydrorhamnose reductase
VIPIPRDVESLEEILSEPRAETIAALEGAPGDVVVLGAGGKMGPTLSRMVRIAADRADGGADSGRRKVFAVSRWTDAEVARRLAASGVSTVTADLLDRPAVAELPDAPNVIFMAGQKFGTRDAPARTWAMNVVVPAWCAERYAGSRIVAFSTGNVYPLTPAEGGGSREEDGVAPVGDYAASCVGRERVFEFASDEWGSKCAMVRLNYAIDLRYGVLLDIAQRVREGVPVDVTMGYVNVIWQGDANRVAIEALARCASPPYVVNVTGLSKLSVRKLATELGRRLRREPEFTGVEAPDALLSDTSRMAADFAAPEVSLEWMLDAVADWTAGGRPTLGKATRFEERGGSF